MKDGVSETTKIASCVVHRNVAESLLSRLPKKIGESQSKNLRILSFLDRVFLSPFLQVSSYKSSRRSH